MTSSVAWRSWASHTLIKSKVLDSVGPKVEEISKKYLCVSHFKIQWRIEIYFQTTVKIFQNHFFRRFSKSLINFKVWHTQLFFWYLFYFWTYWVQNFWLYRCTRCSRLKSKEETSALHRQKSSRDIKKMVVCVTL